MRPLAASSDQIWGASSRTARRATPAATRTATVRPGAASFRAGTSGSADAPRAPGAMERSGRSVGSDERAGARHLRPLGVCGLREIDQLLIVGLGLILVPRLLGGPGRAGQAVEAVRVDLLRALELG